MQRASDGSSSADPPLGDGRVSDYGRLQDRIGLPAVARADESVGDQELVGEDCCLASASRTPAERRGWRYVSRDMSPTRQF
jgi:hypothetical protein